VEHEIVGTDKAHSRQAQAPHDEMEDRQELQVLGVPPALMPGGQAVRRQILRRHDILERA
jgi:hypothetical protein